ncbi:MAG: bifunctional diaminohydroxyphosphoribosylaminopyrimidine deaminase/5-amino-6-(5-phosphoribosylamino)uracil reductase RibD [Kofleriaceae bacterium]|nr:bifunctional diaminohydroxyphosphoribosylaminopyrimidine deaminase/5-amino-6-(5-phosphoribosylamino)uracil reductase RibD [Kofleriaceae bacterium]
MARCLELAAQYRGRTSPNPIVGCVIVDRRGKVLAEGAHVGPGKLHAEADALAKIGGKAKGATLYVNLEPCNHHGRTPPCAPAVRDSGVARVVVGIEDPIPGHAGGNALLRGAGIDVTVGVLREACARANTPFFTWAREGRAAFTLKAAMTLDGKIATVTGHARWVTGEAARADVMRLRDEHDGILVGIGTVLADDPALTARRPGARDPVRIVLDSRLRTPIDAQLLPKARSATRTILIAGPKAAVARERALVAAGAEVWRVPALASGKLDLKRLAKRLGSESILSVLVEGGGEVHASFLAQKLGDELVLYVAPKVVGGPAKSWVGGAGVSTMPAAIPFELDPHVEHLGNDLRLTGVMKR